MKTQFKHIITLLIISLFSTITFAKNENETVITMPPTFETGAYQDFLRNEAINASDKDAIIEKVQRSLKQSLLATRKYKVKVIRKGKLASQINNEIASATVGEEVQYATTYMQDNQARYLISPLITAVTAKRNVMVMNEKTKNYRDSGSISIALMIVDTGMQSEDAKIKGKGAGEQRASFDVNVSYKTPYKRLNNSDELHVNAKFWNSIIKKATAQLVAKLNERSNPLKIIKSGKRRVEISQGSDNGDIEKGYKYNVIDEDDNVVGMVQITKVSARTSKAKVISSTISLEEDFTLEKIENADTDDGDFF